MLLNFLCRISNSGAFESENVSSIDYIGVRDISDVGYGNLNHAVHIEVPLFVQNYQ